MKQFVVIGLGRFGANLARALYRMGNQVLAIDMERHNVEQIKDEVTEAIIADAKNMKVLDEFIDTAIDTVIVATGSDIETSVLATLYLRDLGVQNIIAKAKNDDHGKILTALGVSEVIYPERDIAQRLAERLSMNNLIAHLPLAAEYSILEIKTPEAFIGKSMLELDLRRKYGINVIGIKDNATGHTQVLLEGSSVFPPDSVMMFICRTDQIDKLPFR